MKTLRGFHAWIRDPSSSKYIGGLVILSVVFLMGAGFFTHENQIRDCKQANVSRDGIRELALTVIISQESFRDQLLGDREITPEIQRNIDRFDAKVILPLSKLVSPDGPFKHREC